jgi:hypothetical protein
VVQTIVTSNSAWADVSVMATTAASSACSVGVREEEEVMMMFDQWDEWMME